MAPLAAIIPAIGWPAAAPATSEMAIAMVQGSDENARDCSQFKVNVSRTALRSISEHIAPGRNAEGIMHVPPPRLPRTTRHLKNRGKWL
jgi:hypothetical protein